MIRWYRANKRVLPWRDQDNPYFTWVSEIMLQQTRVSTVIPYFHRFVDTFPTIASLARADVQRVLKMWEGLGYYSRARNLHRAARRVMEEYAGQLPREYAQLRTLPGLGEYTAAAVASIAFHEPIPAVDGNIARVAARYWGLQDDVRRTETKREISRRLAERIDGFDPAEFNQGLMEIGALICRPRNPSCPSCPLRRSCVARIDGTTSTIPQRLSKPPLPRFFVGAGVLLRDGQVWIARRDQQGLLQGLWEFPSVKTKSAGTLARALRTKLSATVVAPLPRMQRICAVPHAYSHYEIVMTAFLCRLESARGVAPAAADSSAARWVKIADLHQYPFDRATLNVIAALRDHPAASSRQRKKEAGATCRTARGECR